VVYGDKKVGIKPVADLKGKRVGVARASTQDVALTAVALKAPRSAASDDAPAMQADVGPVDAIIARPRWPRRLKARAANTYENKFLLRQQVMAVAMRPGQAELLSTVDNFVAKNTANGELNKLYRKWLETDLPKMQ
jgi:polar amino acid transport system substrate-binding protein